MLGKSQHPISQLKIMRKNHWLSTVAVAVLLSCGLGRLIHFQLRIFSTNSSGCHSKVHWQLHQEDKPTSLEAHCSWFWEWSDRTQEGKGSMAWFLRGYSLLLCFLTFRISAEGVDIVLDCLCGDNTGKGLSLLKPLGTYILYGECHMEAGRWWPATGNTVYLCQGQPGKVSCANTLSWWDCVCTGVVLKYFFTILMALLFSLSQSLRWILPCSLSF